MLEILLFDFESERPKTNTSRQRVHQCLRDSMAFLDAGKIIV
jgi:hypothetical protein